MVSFEGVKMLIVDDEEDMCQYPKSYFQRRKFKVFVACDERAALEIAKKERPSIILLDVLLGAASGIELLRKMRKENISSHVIMVTGHVLDDATKESLRDLNIFEFITKPVMLDKLEEVVRSALESKSR